MNNKILLSIPKYSSYFFPIKKNLQLLGYEVFHFDYRHGNFFTKMINLIFGPKVTQNLISRIMLVIIKRNKIDFFLTLKGETITPKFLIEAKKYTTTINWFPDPIQQWDLITRIAGEYTFFLHFDPLIVNKLKKIGFKNVFYLPFAAELNSKNEAKIYEISFVGTYSKYREDYLSVIANYGLNIWGDSRWQSSSLKQYCRGGRINQGQMREVIKKTKININLIYYAEREGANLRVFEVTGSGGFLLSEYVKDLDILFKIGKELEVFKSKKDLLKKINYYLLKSKLREQIAKQGYKKVKMKHNYKLRLSSLFQIIKKFN